MAIVHETKKGETTCDDAKLPGHLYCVIGEGASGISVSLLCWQSNHAQRISALACMSCSIIITEGHADEIKFNEAVPEDAMACAYITT